jgi:hypothetical protein
MGVSPMKWLRNKDLEISGSADENVGKSRAGRPCHLRAILLLVSDRELPGTRQSANSPNNEEFLSRSCGTITPALTRQALHGYDSD